MRFLLHRESPWIPVVLISILIGCWSELDLYAPSFPQMQAYFHTTDQMMMLTLALNFLGFFFASLLCGPLADAYGRRPVILGGSLLFILGSLFCMAAFNIETMLLGRFVQGLGVSAPVTVCIAVVADIYQGERQVKLLTRMNTCITIIMALAPVIGVYLTEHFGWRSNFVAIFAIAILGCLLIWLLVPETHAKESRLEFSATSLVTSYWKLLASRRFMTAVLALCLAITPYFIFIGIMPLLFQQELGISLDAYKYYQGSVVGVFAVLSLFVPVIMKRVNANRLMRASFMTSALAMVASVAACFTVADNAMLITVLMWIYTAGIVIGPMLMFAEAMEMHPDLRACSSSLIQALRMLCMALGAYVAGFFYDGHYKYAAIVMLLFMLGSLPFAMGVIRRRESSTQAVELSASAMH